MPGTLKCHGVVRELKEVGVGGGGGGGGERGGFAGPKREIQPHRGWPQSLSASAGCSFAEGAAKANQMQRRLLCATTCQVQPGST